MSIIGNNNPHCRIVVDAMGGDYAPLNSVLGAVEAYNQSGSFDLFLVGKEEVIKIVISYNNLDFDS
jgi:glycerol-3-phosphate acyltransferase PlsX